MIEKKTIAKSGEHLSGNLQFYTMFVTFDISATNDFNDKSQKVLQTIINLIHIRAQTVILGDPYYTADLAAEGSEHLTGEGYVMKFTSEHEEVFALHDEYGQTVDPVYYLNHFLNDVQFDNDLTFFTEGVSRNVEFKRYESI